MPYGWAPWRAVGGGASGRVRARVRARARVRVRARVRDRDRARVRVRVRISGGGASGRCMGASVRGAGSSSKRWSKLADHASRLG